MIFGGFQPFTLTDFPGRVAAIAFTQGCNFRCPWCHNGRLWESSPDTLDEDTVLDFLAHRKGKIEGLVVSGGEPTMQPDLPDFLRKVKALGFATKLDTNGSRADVVYHLLREGLVDFIAMDVKAPFEKYDLLAGVPAPVHDLQESMQAIAQSGIGYEFRTTCVTPMLDAADLRAIRALLPEGAFWRKQPYRPELACDPALRV
jgi:pyruvate formate lyase activating enzyme